MKKIIIMFLCLFMLCGCGNKEERKTKTNKEVDNVMKVYDVKWNDDYSEEYNTQSLIITNDDNMFFVVIKCVPYSDKFDLMFINYSNDRHDGIITIYDQIMEAKNETYKTRNKDEECINYFDNFLEEKDITNDELIKWIKYVIKDNQ